MKKVFNLRTIFMICILAVFASCSKDSADGNPESAPGAESQVARYTVMFYGCGGKSLDENLIQDIDELKAAGRKDSVQFAGLIKYSGQYQDEAPYSGTRYLSWDKDSLHSDKKYESTYRLDNPAHLTSFIQETAKNMPARKYILVIWNHGSEFGFGDKEVQSDYPEPVSRAALFDDNLDDEGNIALSTYELEKAIKDAGVKIELIYFDCCVTGMVETCYQLKDCAHYYMGAFEFVPGESGEYTVLMNNLQDKPSLEEAIRDYVPKTIEIWRNGSGKEGDHDLSCIDLSNMEELKNQVKGYTGQLNKLMLSNDVANSMRYWNRNENPNRYFFTDDTFSNRVSADLSSSFDRLAYLLNDETLIAYAKEIEKTCNGMVVAHKSYGLPEWLDKVTMGINWPSFYQWAFYHDTKWQKPEYAKSLANSAFLKETGWINILDNFPTVYEYKEDDAIGY